MPFGKESVGMEFKNVTTHYMDSQYDGVRVCRIDNSPMQVIVVPRDRLKDAKALPSGEMPWKNGVYFLVEAADAELPSMYAGQTTNGLFRLDDHKANKNFWTFAVMFLADSAHFTTDIISALERKAIEAVEESQRYHPENKKPQNYRISEFQKKTVETYFGDIKFVMATLGYNLDPSVASDSGEWHTKRNGIVANGRYRNGTMELLPGSQIDMEHDKITPGYAKLRASLLKSGDIVKEKTGKYLLKKVVTFKTPSGASDFVLGRASNGWVEWTNDKGEPLDTMRK